MLAINPTLYRNAPDGSKRLEKEMRVYELLDSLSIPYIRLDHEEAATVDSCQKIDEMLEINICKNLFLCNSQETNFYLLMIPGNKKLKTAELSKQLNCSRLSFANESYLEKFLNLTPGSVTVLGLMHDCNNRVQLIIDRDLIAEEYFGCHPCINTSSLKIKCSDLIDKFLPYVKHSPIYVDLT